MKNKLVAIFILTICDIGLAIYTYFTLSNFDEFKKILVMTAQIDSPDFQREIYKIFLQTLTFISFSLVLSHLLIYFLYYKDKSFAKAYVKYYAILAGVSLLASAMFLNQYILVIPTMFYFYALFHALKHDPMKKAQQKV